MNGHPQFEEDFDLYAMGALEPEEKQALESHLQNCAECTAKLQEAQGRMAMLALAAPQQNVPAGVKDRLMRQVRAEAPKVQAAGVSVFSRWLVPALAVAALALALLAVQLKLENRELRREQADLQEETLVLRQETERERLVLDLLNATDTVKVTLVSGTAHPVPEGRAFLQSPQRIDLLRLQPAGPILRPNLPVVDRSHSGQSHQRRSVPSGRSRQRPGDVADAASQCRDQSVCRHA